MSQKLEQISEENEEHFENPINDLQASEIPKRKLIKIISGGIIILVIIALIIAAIVGT